MYPPNVPASPSETSDIEQQDNTTLTPSRYRSAAREAEGSRPQGRPQGINEVHSRRLTFIQGFACTPSERRARLFLTMASDKLRKISESLRAYRSASQRTDFQVADSESLAQQQRDFGDPDTWNLIAYGIQQLMPVTSVDAFRQVIEQNDIREADQMLIMLFGEASTALHRFAPSPTKRHLAAVRYAMKKMLAEADATADSIEAAGFQRTEVPHTLPPPYQQFILPEDEPEEDFTPNLPGHRGANPQTPNTRDAQGNFASPVPAPQRMEPQRRQPPPSTAQELFGFLNTRNPSQSSDSPLSGVARWVRSMIGMKDSSSRQTSRTTSGNQSPAPFDLRQAFGPYTPPNNPPQTNQAAMTRRPLPTRTDDKGVRIDKETAEEMTSTRKWTRRFHPYYRGQPCKTFRHDGPSHVYHKFKCVTPHESSSEETPPECSSSVSIGQAQTFTDIIIGSDDDDALYLISESPEGVAKIVVDKIQRSMT